MTEITICFIIIFCVLCITSVCLCNDDCCCELCMNANHTVDEFADELGEVSKVSSPIQDNSNHICVEI
jgi:hypothetical protein